jgi:hypothetical protein
MKSKNDYVITKSNLTLTQSGMLSLLLERQRCRVIELARRRAHWDHLRSTLSGTLNRLLTHTHGAGAGRLFD